MALPNKTYDSVNFLHLALPNNIEHIVNFPYMALPNKLLKSTRIFQY